MPKIGGFGELLRFGQILEKELKKPFPVSRIQGDDTASEWQAVFQFANALEVKGHGTSQTVRSSTQVNVNCPESVSEWQLDCNNEKSPRIKETAVLK